MKLRDLMARRLLRLPTELSPIGTPFAIDGELYTIESIGNDGAFYLIHHPR